MLKEGLTFQMNKSSRKTGGRMQEWPYAELTSMAKQMGGPQKMIETITSNARTEGRMDMIPWLGAAALIGAGAKWGYDKVKGYINNRKKAKEEAERAQEVLVKIIAEETLGDSQAGEATA
ncbi:hypothetical protein E0L17_10690 [Olsenella sp. SW781]|uniref:hypothetical protein n=1 Tax=Olsenella sp. SW781 TaxID=2530046 RepID=UPI001439B0EF|nr:hypothetical protein [Olsenella sp. SW781]NJE81779.1 hypothetical protein [Olsenella sp. SW781]